MFFNGIGSLDRKIAWIGRKTVLASNKKDGLGVSSFFATNRALLFKWVWHFITHESSLWIRFIKAVHGEIGALDKSITTTQRSPWLDIIRELSYFKSKG